MHFRPKQLEEPTIRERAEGNLNFSWRQMKSDQLSRINMKLSRERQSALNAELVEEMKRIQVSRENWSSFASFLMKEHEDMSKWMVVLSGGFLLLAIFVFSSGCQHKDSFLDHGRGRFSLHGSPDGRLHIIK